MFSKNPKLKTVGNNGISNYDNNINQINYYLYYNFINRVFDIMVLDLVEKIRRHFKSVGLMTNKKSRPVIRHDHSDQK
jgi:hypothetical protein